MEQIKVVVTGPFGAGKTQFINTISEIDVVTTERRISVPEQRKIKEETTVAMDYGYITIKKDVVLELFGTPGQRPFRFHVRHPLQRDVGVCRFGRQYRSLELPRG